MGLSGDCKNLLLNHLKLCIRQDLALDICEFFFEFDTGGELPSTPSLRDFES
jgi:hypothetical protein